MTMPPQFWKSPHGRVLPQPGGRTLLMGILNVTPDSFSDGGKFAAVDEAVRQATHLVEEGVDVLDIGGESTRPGAAQVTAREETERVLPVIRALRKEFPQLAVSIDTYKAEVAEAAVEAGADMVNDVWGGRHGLEPHVWAAWSAGVQAGAETDALAPSPIAQVVARLGCPIILMHNRPEARYEDFWDEVLHELRVSLALTRAAGVPAHQCWVDPGFGFGKTPPQNLEVLKHLDRVCGLGYPVLLGTSRKSTIGLVLEREVEVREEGTQVTLVWGVAKGCAMVRVHDVARARHTLLMADAIGQGLNFEKVSPASPREHDFILMDTIRIENIGSFGFHGVYAAEREHGQRFAASVALRVPLREAGLTDELSGTVDYVAVIRAVQEVLAGPALRTLEAVAEKTASLLLERFTRIWEVELTLFKPEAPIEDFDGTVSVTIKRSRAS